MSTATTSSAARPGPPTGGPGNNNNNNNTLDTFMGTNVYLYGFLSTLILIFLVSVAVAYKGYRTRILLRQRIDEALAAGVFIPGLSLDDGTSSRRRREAGEKPIMSEVWVHRSRDRSRDTNANANANVDKWDQLQPLSLQPALHLSPSSNTNSEPSTPLTLEEWAAQHPLQPGPRLLFLRTRQLRSSQRRPRPPSSEVPPPPRVVANSPMTSLPVASDGIRQPPTPPLPPSSSPSVSLTTPLPNLIPNQPQQPQQQAVDVPLLLGIMIAMPDPTRPQVLSYHLPQGSMTSAKGKKRDSHVRDGDESENVNVQLPELVLGCADVPLVVRRTLSPGSTAVPVSKATAVGS